MNLVNEDKNDRDSVRFLIAAFCAIKLIIHLALINRYGYHGDELYFIECGKHLAFGYVDHASMVPWLARLAGALGEYSLASIRILAIFAGVTTIALTMLTARAFGGGTFALLIAGICALIAPAYLVMSGMLNIPVFEPVYWTVCNLLIIGILNGKQRKLWLVVGVVAGIGLLNKHTMLLWGTGIGAGLLLTKDRRELASPWPWAGGAIALLLFAPNLVWQMQHGWPTLEFIRNIDKGMLAAIPRSLFVLGQLLFMHPLTAPVWILGLVYFFSEQGRTYRVFGWLYISAFVILLVRHGKPYYLAPAYPMLFAGGAVLLERWSALGRRRTLRPVFASALAAGGIALAPLALPVLPLPVAEGAIEKLFGRVVPPQALTGDWRLQHGWETYVETFAEVYENLSGDEQSSSSILTKKYNIASAVNFFGPQYGLPRAYSGHMTYYFWGPPPRTSEIVLVCGYEPEFLENYFEEVSEVATLSHPLGDDEFDNRPVFLCRAPKIALAESWHEFRRFFHVDPFTSVREPVQPVIPETPEQ